MSCRDLPVSTTLGSELRLLCFPTNSHFLSPWRSYIIFKILFLILLFKYGLRVSLNGSPVEGYEVVVPLLKATGKLSWEEITAVLIRSLSSSYQSQSSTPKLLFHFLSFYEVFPSWYISAIMLPFTVMWWREGRGLTKTSNMLFGPSAPTHTLTNSLI